MSSTASGSPLPRPTDHVPAAPRPGGLHRAELRGRAIGSSVLAFFAFGWTVCGTSDVRSPSTPSCSPSRPSPQSP